MGSIIYLLEMVVEPYVVDGVVLPEGHVNIAFVHWGRRQGEERGGGKISQPIKTVLVWPYYTCV
jgi:hypothetical protein